MAGRLEGKAALLNLYLQCYTQQEIAEAVGLPQQRVADLLPEICNYKIPVIPGLFTDDAPVDRYPPQGR